MKTSIKGQISLYLIIGLVLFILIAVVFYYYKTTQNQKAQDEAQKIQTLNLQAHEISKFIADCIKKVSFQGLKQLGQKGGYLEIPSLMEFEGTALWQIDQVNIQPFLNQTKVLLLDYLNKNIPSCLESLNISNYGFVLESRPPAVSVELGNSDVTVKAVYPIRLSKGQFTKEFSDFFSTFNIRYRAIFEAASEINKRMFDPDFDIKEPLKKLDYLKSLDFDISYKTPDANIIAFTVTDKKSVTPENQNYVFNFAAKFGNSTLKKVTLLQKSSATNPIALPFTIFSVDKRAQLDMTSGTTISKKGQDVEEINVYQSYINETKTKDVPVHKRNDKVVERKDLTYVITDPIYSFEPDGLLFNKQQKLTLYYQGDEQTEKGVGVLMGKKSTLSNGTKSEFWIPIPSHHESEERRVAANILGFTEFTAVRCAAQQLKETTGEHFFEPKTTCYISLAVMVLAIIAIFSIVAIAAVAVLAGTASSFTAALSVAASTTGLSSLGVSLGTIATVLTVVAVGSTIVNVSTDAFYGTSPDNCETFYPICDQNIVIEKSGDGEGKCIPDTGKRVAAGTSNLVCGQVEKCSGGFVGKITCKTCSVKCTAKFY